MQERYWSRVVADGFRIPTDRRLDDLTAELTQLLGSPDSAERDRLAYTTLATWIARGVYDDLLGALGDGMAVGMGAGLGEEGTDSVFRRSFSVLVLTECLHRDLHERLLPRGKVLEWGDRVVGWYLRERDVRGYVAEKGWAHALAHGADAIAALAASPHLELAELTVLLDVVADRLLLPMPPLVHGETDRMAVATLAVLRRGRVPFDITERWIARLAAGASPFGGTGGDPYGPTGNAQQFLRSLYLLTAMHLDPPAERADLLLCLAGHLRQTNEPYLST